MQTGNLDLLVEGSAVHHTFQGAAGVKLTALTALHRQHLFSLLFQPSERLLLTQHLPLALGDAVGDGLPDDPVEEPDQQAAATHCHQPLLAGADAAPPAL